MDSLTPAIPDIICIRQTTDIVLVVTPLGKETTLRSILQMLLYKISKYKIINDLNICITNEATRQDEIGFNKFILTD